MKTNFLVFFRGFLHNWKEEKNVQIHFWAHHIFKITCKNSLESFYYNCFVLDWCSQYANFDTKKLFNIWMMTLITNTYVYSYCLTTFTPPPSAPITQKIIAIFLRYSKYFKSVLLLMHYLLLKPESSFKWDTVQLVCFSRNQAK